MVKLRDRLVLARMKRRTTFPDRSSISTDQDRKFVEPVVVEKCYIARKIGLTVIEKETRVRVVQMFLHLWRFRIFGQRIERQPLLSEAPHMLECIQNVVLPFGKIGIGFNRDQSARDNIVSRRQGSGLIREFRGMHLLAI